MIQHKCFPIFFHFTCPVMFHSSWNKTHSLPRQTLEEQAVQIKHPLLHYQGLSSSPGCLLLHFPKQTPDKSPVWTLPCPQEKETHMKLSGDSVGFLSSPWRDSVLLLMVGDQTAQPSQRNPLYKSSLFHAFYTIDISEPPSEFCYQFQVSTLKTYRPICLGKLSLLWHLACGAGYVYRLPHSFPHPSLCLPMLTS